MIHLLKAEWIVWSRSRIAWVVVAIGVVSMAFYPVLVLYARGTQNPEYTDMVVQTLSFPLVINSMGVLLFYPAQIFSLLVIITVCHDFEFRTYRLYLLNNMSRKQLWLSKFYTNIVLSIFIGLLSLLIAVCFGLYYGGDFTLKPIRWIFILVFQVFIFLNFALVLSTFIKKTGLAIIVFLIWFVALDRTIAQTINYSLHWHPVGNLMPGKSTESLTHLIAFQNILIQDHTYYFLRVSFSVLWLCFSLVMSYRIYNKQDF